MNCLPFLDVLVTKARDKFVTTVYRKPTFTGQYVSWQSFSPRKLKVSLIRTLVHRALLICSDCALDKEIAKIKSIFGSNGYPDRIVNATIANKIKYFTEPKPFGPKKCPAYIRLPWIGTVSNKFESQIISSVQRCYGMVEPRVIFGTRQSFPATRKDVLSTTQHSNIIYEFTCYCDSSYVGRTSQRLHERIKQHIPKKIRSVLSTTQDTSDFDSAYNEAISSSSAIGLHLIKNPQCAKNYRDERFSIIAHGRSTFHLSVLESMFIKLKQPSLCRQKEFVYSLKLFR